MAGRVFLLLPWLALASAWLWGNAAYAQTQAQVVWQRLQAPQGLPGRKVGPMLTDNAGFVWLATNEGLCRWNGQFFQRVPDAAIGQAGHITALAQDADSAIWIGYAVSGLMRYVPRTGKLSTYDLRDGLLSKRITTLAPLPKHGVFVGTEDQGGFMLTKEDVFERVASPQGKGMQITASAFTPSFGLVWGDARGQVYAWAAQRVSRLAQLPAPASGIAEGPGNILWMSTLGAGLQEMRIGQPLVGHPRSPGLLQVPASNALTFLHAAKSGMLYMGTDDRGLVAYNINTQQFSNSRSDPANPATIASDRIRAATTTTDGVVLAASDNGLSVLDATGQQFEVVRPGGGEGAGGKFGTVASILQTTDGRLWCGSGSGGGLVVMDLASNTESSFKADLSGPYHLPSNSITCLLQDRKGRIWVGSEGGGLAVLRDAKSSRFLPVFVPKTEIKGTSVIALLQLHNGKVVAAMSNGLYLASAALHALIPYSLGVGAQPLPEGITALAQTTDGSLWVGTRTGLYRVDSARHIAMAYGQHPAFVGRKYAGRITSLAADAEGHLWVGTYGDGLLRIDQKTNDFLRLNEAEGGLPNNVVQALLPTRQGHVWVATLKGLAEVVPVGEGQAVISQQYDARDGLPPGQLNNHAAFASPNGELSFGVQDALVRFEPRALPSPLAPPQAVLTQLLVDEREASAPLGLFAVQDVVVPAGTSLLRFQFAGRGFGHRGSLRFRYRLLGLDSAWQNTATTQTQPFNHLATRQYTFQVQAAHANGTFGPASTLRITVSSPFWQRPGFALLVLGAITGSVFLVLFLRERSSRRTTRRLEETVAERTTALRNTNAELAKTLSQLRRTQAQLIEAEGEAARTQGERRFKALIENSNDGIFLLGPSADLLYASRRAVAILARPLTPGSVVGLPDFVHEADYTRLLKTFLQVRNAAGSLRFIQFRAAKSDENEVWLEASLSNQLETPEVQAIVVNFRDITRRIHTDSKIQDINRELSSLVYKASHDIRGPIASMLGVAQVAKAEVTDTNALRYFEMMNRSATRLDIQLSELLEAVQIKEAVVQPGPIEWNSLLASVHTRVKDTAGYGEVHFVNELDATARLNSDRNVVSLALQHLLENAVRYRLRTGRPFVVVSVVATTNGAVITVKDNGPGMDISPPEMAFEMFRRASAHSSGSGLGLYIVKKAVERLDGTITLRSSPENGTAFMISLPNL